MPITLNHSNIGVQYSSDKSYIIENVKSDLYRRNEIADTIARDNIQAAPVTPSIYIENGTNNVYAVESYTYSGTANTTDYSRVFTKSTTCDILVVGGGGGGGKRAGGGGGAGTLLYHKNVIFNGTYNIKVGKGGAGHPSSISTTTSTAFDGEFSQFVKTDGTQNYYAVGGGRGMGSLAPNIYARTNGGQGFLYDSNLTLSPNNIFNGVPVVVSNKQYVNTLPLPEGCRGNIGGLQINNYKSGGGGGAGGVGMNHAEETTINDGYGGLGLAIDITGTSVVYAGGGNGTDWDGTLSQVFDPSYPTIQLRGGGGFGSDTGTPQNGLDGTGGGGGAQGNDTAGNPSGAGGSGIVIIRYLLGTIPATNYLTNEPVVIAPTFTETIRSFTHSGGAETQTTYTITVGQNTICDILVVAGGGGGGNDRGGGGGGGGVIYSQNVTLNGTYTINVGKGGIGTTSGIPSGRGTRGTNGINSSISGSGLTTLTAIGGGGGGACASGIRDGLSGGSGGGGSQYNGAGSGGTGTIEQGNNGGIGYEAGAGGGGGGVVAVGTNANSTNAGNGGIGLSNSITGTTVIYGSGGGGGGSSGSGLLPQVFGTGGSIGAGNGGNGHINGNNATVFGCGGGGGGLAQTSVTTGGNGFAGIVIIKFKSIVGAGILEGTTHKRLNFAFDSLGYSFDATKSVEYQAQQKTGVGGWRIVRYLPPNLGRWYQGDYISTSTFNIPTIGTPYNYTNEWGVPFGTFDEMFFGTFDMTYWLYCLKTSVLGSYSNGARPIIKSSFSSTSYTALWYNRSTGAPEDPWIRIVQEDNSSIVYGENNNPDHSSLRNAYGGMCVLVRDSATGTTIPNPNQYTLNFPVPTLADINNNSNIILRGSYDIALNTINAIVIPKTGQYIPQPTTFTNYSVERMYPPVRNFTAATTIVSGQTYGNGTYVVSYSSTYGNSYDPFKCFNTSDVIGGHWATSRYTAGIFNSTSFIVSGYLGDWIKIQLPVAIKLTRFEFKQRITNPNDSPKDFKIYGSNDNITWVELVNKTGAAYNASYIYEQTTPDISNAYTYYGLVVNKVFETSTILNFDEWYIYGQEVLTSSLSLRYNLLNPTQDPIGAQWTYNTSNMNVYNMGSVGVGTTNPEYHLDVSGSLNAKTLMYNGSSINSLGLSAGMIAQVQHLTYTKMELKDNTGWDAINEDLTSGFVIKITPKSSLSKMLVNLIVFIGMSTSADNAWWGIKLYRKIGTGSWTEITGCNGTETGSAAATAGTPVWISNNTGMFSYNESITNASGTYLDSPNTTSTVYYTAYWNQRLGDNPSVTGQMFLNRASSQNDGYRPAPSSSWTVEEIWYG